MRQDRTGQKTKAVVSYHARVGVRRQNTDESSSETYTGQNSDENSSEIYRGQILGKSSSETYSAGGEPPTRVPYIYIYIYIIYIYMTLYWTGGLISCLL